MTNLGFLTARLAPTERAAPDDFRWAAGFYEGEGCCRPHPSVVITQKDSWVLERMRALFGGSVRKSNSREIHTWQINGARARAFLMSIYGLLSPHRQEQIRDALGLQG